MRNIEQKISPLISNMFPAFYQEEGQNFITFIEAYYEWLEQNFQLIDLIDNTGFNVGQTIQQDTVTGQIIAFVDKSLLVNVTGLETFKCFNVCSEFIPISTTDSAGVTYSTYITKGGTTKRLGPIFFSRNLPNIRDIDKTIDLFVVQFKEKYLKNIEFDIQSNQQLLVKNSLDLYRSKGTERSIDLFFRLVYGVSAQTLYPGDDLFRLSDAEWYKPQYIEINSSSVDRAISLVGKQISGVTSGATAFVERYVKRYIKNSISHILYVSSVKGTFSVNEILKSSAGLFADSPRVIGSLSETRILNKSEYFSVGDVVDLTSVTGSGALGRVSSVEPGTGKVYFSIIDSGYGYTVNSIDSDQYHSQTKTSDKFLTLSNITAGPYVSNVVINNGGTGYTNTDLIQFTSLYNKATAKIITDSAGTIKKTVVTNKGSGFFPSVRNEITITNSTGGPSSGTTAAVLPVLKYPENYFQLLEPVVQTIYTVPYPGTLNSKFTLGSQIYVNDDILNYKIVGIDSVNNTIKVFAYSKNIPINYGDNIILVSDPAQTFRVNGTATANTTVGEILYISNSGIVKLGIPVGNITDFSVGGFVYQLDDTNNIVGSGIISNNRDLKLDGGYIDITNISGIFFKNKNLYVKDTITYAEFQDITLEIAVANTQGTFLDTNLPGLYSNTSGIVADINFASVGSGAAFKIGSITDTETVSLNVDQLANTSLLNNYINSGTYGFTKDPSAGLNTIILKALEFKDFNIGSINTLTGINPGTNYTRDPITYTYQPYITGYQRKDYIMSIQDGTSSFVVGELVTQQVEKSYLKLTVANTSPFQKNERLIISNTSHTANGTLLSIDTANNTLTVSKLTRSITNPTTIQRYIATGTTSILGSNAYTSNTIAKGIIKGFSNREIYVKRIQFENEFVTNSLIYGEQTGSTAKLINITPDDTTRPIGLNANILADAITADGTVTGIQVIDSGFGYRTDQELTYVSSDGLRSGTATAIDSGVGVGTGYYRTSKGFVSDVSKVHDGDYYQEYSYDIISRIPLDKYSEMFKKVMHTAGTRFFGNVLIDTVAKLVPDAVDGYISLANTEVEIANSSAFVIQDRYVVDIADRKKVNIEIRD